MKLGSEARFPLGAEWARIQESELPPGELHPEGDLVAFPLKIEWLATQPAVLEEAFPVPLRGSTDTGGVPEVPEPVLKLQRDAQGAGWATRLTYAEGYVPHATHGRPGEAAKPSWAVRMARGVEGAVAVRRGGTWESFWRWGPDLFFAQSGSLAAFTDDVAGVLVDQPSAVEWSRMLVKYPLKPTKKQLAEMETAHEAYREARSGAGVRAEGEGFA